MGDVVDISHGRFYFSDPFTVYTCLSIGSPANFSNLLSVRNESMRSEPADMLARHWATGLYKIVVMFS